VRGAKLGFRIREKETEKDIENLLRLGFETFKDGVFHGVDIPEEALREKYRKLMARYDLDKPDQRIFVADDEEGRFAGLIWVGIQKRGEVESVEKDEKYAWIFDIEVDPESRGRGLGSKLLSHAEGWARDQGAGAIELHVFANNSVALNLYRKYGYEEKSYILSKEISPT
jgi:ribosomal protein S18 acetylase RimI-like enzyme